jgi:hypothetical protein
MKNPLQGIHLNAKTLGSIVSLGILSLGLVGCATSKTVSQTITIDSDPPGVRIEANGEDLGRTPTSYVAKANRRGNFAGGWGEFPSVVFVAFPPDGLAGMNKQYKSFSPSGFMDAGDRVPSRVFFDMHQEPGR